MTRAHAPLADPVRPERRPAQRAGVEGRPSTSGPRQIDALAVTIGRILLAPFAVLLAAIAGLVYAVLLPICGIASIGEATARASWAFARDAFRRTRQRAAARA